MELESDTVCAVCLEAIGKINCCVTACNGLCPLCRTTVHTNVKKQCGFGFVVGSIDDGDEAMNDGDEATDDDYEDEDTALEYYHRMYPDSSAIYNLHELYAIHPPFIGRSKEIDRCIGIKPIDILISHHNMMQQRERERDNAIRAKSETQIANVKRLAEEACSINKMRHMERDINSMWSSSNYCTIS